MNLETIIRTLYNSVRGSYGDFQSGRSPYADGYIAGFTEAIKSVAELSGLDFDQVTMSQVEYQLRKELKELGEDQ